LNALTGSARIAGPAACYGCFTRGVTPGSVLRLCVLGAVIWLARVGTPQPSGNFDPMRAFASLSENWVMADYFFMATSSAIIAPNVRRVGIRRQDRIAPVRTAKLGPNCTGLGT